MNIYIRTQLFYISKQEIWKKVKSAKTSKTLNILVRTDGKRTKLEKYIQSLEMQLKCSSFV